MAGPEVQGADVVQNFRRNFGADLDRFVEKDPIFIESKGFGISFFTIYM
jgi:hypothetical protein